MRIIDKDGKVRDWAWLRQEFGTVEVNEGDGPWRCVELREADGAATTIVTVRDRDGNPIAGALVARWWPEPSLPGLPMELAEWSEIGVFGETNENGDIGFGMGHGDYYYPPGEGASAVWTMASSDKVQGLGMLGGTNHRHLNVVFQWVSDTPSPEPQPEPEPDPPTPPEPPVVGFEAAVLDRLDRIIGLLEST